MDWHPSLVDWPLTEAYPSLLDWPQTEAQLSPKKWRQVVKGLLGM